MEGCKERAADAGLSFDKETLEYFVTNTDMLELSPKNMIPTLYDYWLQDIQVLKGKGEYDLYPNNPYETVINTRPAISFYNDNNPDWLNVMIFYHVIAHIDFFQNNVFFENTWDYDLKEKALADKRMVAKLRSEKGRVVDYVIEFTRGIDNLVGYFDEFKYEGDDANFKFTAKIEYYFNYFLQKELKAGMKFYLEEVERFNSIETEDEKAKEEEFLSIVKQKNTEFESLFLKSQDEKKVETVDLIQFILEESPFLNKEKNIWMKSIIEVVRETSIYFSPQIRTKIMNEGWASYWHEKLFLMDDRIKGNEVAFARINAKVTSLSKVGLNPYAIGWRLFMYIEEMHNRGAYSYEYKKLKDKIERKNFNKDINTGRDFIFYVRQNYCDFTFINSFIEQDFIDHYKLMVVGQRINEQKNVKEYFVKSRKAEDYKDMIKENLYHPPNIKYRSDDSGTLYLDHEFEGKELYKEYIPNTLVGIEYLWGNTVKLETSEIAWDEMQKKVDSSNRALKISDIEPIFKRVVYTVKDKKITKMVIS